MQPPRLRITITAEYTPNLFDHPPGTSLQQIADVDHSMVTTGTIDVNDLPELSEVHVTIVPASTPITAAVLKEVVDKYPDRKIFAIKEIRMRTGCSLPEAKDAFEAEVARREDAARAAGALNPKRGNARS